MKVPSYVDQCVAAINPYITGQANTCSYCDHLSPLILQEGKHTYITLAIGQIVEGYLQLCAQKHRTAATGLYDYETDEMEEMKIIIREAYQAVYGNRGIAFEHGKAGSCLWREKSFENLHDLCHHFHMHFLPVAIDIRDRVKKIMPDELVVKTIAELKEIRKELGAGPYLYFEDTNSVGYVYPVENTEIPRQFLRTCVAEELGVPERADWIIYPGYEYFETGRDNLQPILFELYAKKFTK